MRKDIYSLACKHCTLKVSVHVSVVGLLSEIHNIFVIQLLNTLQFQSVWTGEVPLYRLCERERNGLLYCIHVLWPSI